MTDGYRSFGAGQRAERGGFVGVTALSDSALDEREQAKCRYNSGPSVCLGDGCVCLFAISAMRETSDRSAAHYRRARSLTLTVLGTIEEILGSYFDRP